MKAYPRGSIADDMLRKARKEGLKVPPVGRLIEHVDGSIGEVTEHDFMGATWAGAGQLYLRVTWLYPSWREGVRDVMPLSSVERIVPRSELKRG